MYPSAYNFILMRTKKNHDMFLSSVRKAKGEKDKVSTSKPNFLGSSQLALT